MPELPTDTYFVEMHDNNGVWNFRVVDSNGDPVDVYDLSSDGGSLTDGWQPVPNSNNFDTGRGITIQFAPGTYSESIRGGSVTPPPFPAANAVYTARGTQVGTMNDGAASVSMGNFFSGKGAIDITVSDYIKADHNRIATAASADSPGDGSVALEIARLKAKTLVNGNSTINNYFRSLITQLGQHSEQASVMTDNQELLVKHLEGRQSEFAGVSLDEETVYLLQYQRTYQAAARVMTTVDEMLEKVINGMGLVGR
jgi:flagellar hook-associated protein 1 FlgK